MRAQPRHELSQALPVRFEPEPLAWIMQQARETGLAPAEIVRQAVDIAIAELARLRKEGA